MQTLYSYYWDRVYGECFSVLKNRDDAYDVASDEQANNSSSAGGSSGGGSATVEPYSPTPTEPDDNPQSPSSKDLSSEYYVYETEMTEAEISALYGEYSFLEKFDAISGVKRTAVATSDEDDGYTLSILNLGFYFASDDYTVTAYFIDSGADFTEDGFNDLSSSTEAGGYTVYYSYDEEICVHYIKTDLGEKTLYMAIKIPSSDSKSVIAEIFD